MAWFLPLLAVVSLIVWLHLVFRRGGFWRAEERLPTLPAPRPAWPEVVALVPARNEAAVVGRAIGSLLVQDYPGRFRVVLVDDHSEDGTAAAARRAAHELERSDLLAVAPAAPLPAGWAGKLWALAEGLRHAEAGGAPRAEYYWLTDADIEHEPRTLRRLVGKAEGGHHDLVSLMALLSCASPWERLLVPPFVYFFQLLYPFPWVNDPRRRTAAAAGGCILVRRAALARIGGFAAIRGALIDDLALARAVKRGASARGGGLWLGLTRSVRSLRPYAGLREIWDMVARSAYTQLRYSRLRLAGMLVAMAVTFLAPPLLVLGAPWHGSLGTAAFGLAAWALMAYSAWPTLSLYRQPAWLAPALPLAAALYCAMALDSAWRHRRGTGGLWKGRVQPALR